MKRYICIHGHFYQPPRENPWLEAIEAQDSARPYHDWNERITAECYAPNAAARLLDGDNLIVKIVNNYEKLSFNFGPTILAWMEAKAPKIYAAILFADRQSQSRYAGHGSALAQVYNHLIMPLANQRDKETQVRWGIVDFESRFGRRPEGMWLAETAVDRESLEALAANGIAFTILSPYQAKRARQPDGRWQDVGGGKIDPTTAYRQMLPSGRSIDLFFYDGPISRGVAFERLLSHGETYANRLLGAFSDSRDWPQLVHIATDGETYGHHHRYGDMALAYALQYIEDNKLAILTNYGQYLEGHPPVHEVEIIEQSSWSCVHGVERWRSDCGCKTGGGAGWNQSWRAPLREALDWLRDEIAPLYERRCGRYLEDPWQARNDYIHVILDRSPESLEAFFGRNAAGSLSEQDKIATLKLLELQRHAMLMYTSCGWFFNELSGIETVQVIQYAGRALQLAQDLFGDHLEAKFLELLEKSKSNVAEHRDGRHIYEQQVRPAVVDLEEVGAHYSISSLFESYPDEVRLACYRFERQDSQTFESGRSKLVTGRVKVISEITRESAVLSFGALHFGGHNVNGGVRRFVGEDAYQELLREVAAPFDLGDFAAVIRLLDRHFGESTYSLKSLFRDQQRKILDKILESALSEAEAVYRQLHEHHAPTMRFLTDLGIPSPEAFSTAARFAINSNLRRAFASEELDPQRIESLLRSAKAEGVRLDTEQLAFAWRESIERLARRLFEKPTDLELLKRLDSTAGLLKMQPFEVDLWKVQNGFYLLLEETLPEMRAKAEQGDESAQVWLKHSTSLGERLSVEVP